MLVRSIVCKYTLFNRGASSPSVADVNPFAFCEFLATWIRGGLVCEVVANHARKVDYFATRLGLLLFSNIVSRFKIVCRGSFVFRVNSQARSISIDVPCFKRGLLSCAGWFVFKHLKEHSFGEIGFSGDWRFRSLFRGRYAWHQRAIFFCA